MIEPLKKEKKISVYIVWVGAQVLPALSFTLHDEIWVGG